MTISGNTTAEKILAAGRQLIMTRGYSNFSYADIAAAVAIHKASIHHHFPSKADLALAVVHQAQNIFDADCAATKAAGQDPLQQLQSFINFWHHSLIHDPEVFCIAGMLGAEAPFLPPPVAQAVHEYFADILGWLKRVVTAGVASGQMQLDDADLAAEELLSVIYGAVLVARAMNNPAHFDKVCNAALVRLQG
jgi:TetR/AcrR family transcriptional repressor of nem operon